MLAKVFRPSDRGGMNALQHRILSRLADLKPGTTMCPGKLSRDCDTTLSEAREDMMILARANKIALSQGGKMAKPELLKGPFRVRLS